jgi:hypothetical protein
MFGRTKQDVKVEVRRLRTLIELARPYPRAAVPLCDHRTCARSIGCVESGTTDHMMPVG